MHYKCIGERYHDELDYQSTRLQWERATIKPALASALTVSISTAIASYTISLQVSKNLKRATSGSCEIQAPKPPTTNGKKGAQSKISFKPSATTKRLTGWVSKTSSSATATSAIMPSLRTAKLRNHQLEEATPRKVAQSQ